MAKRVSAAQAKAQLSALASGAAFRGERYVIERRGKPVAALVSMDDLERLEQEREPTGKPLGLLALVGAWRELGDDEIDEMVRIIYAERERDLGRPVSFGDECT
ncbi:MAG: type II toxin-antitoxin system Phd/YefM family antitoxin [Chloroflexota bacterium]